MSDFLAVLVVAGAAGLASPLGGLIALWHFPSTLIMSLALGLAGGVLLGTVAFEMMPKALELSSAGVAIAGFVLGFAALYGWDLFVNRGRVAGAKAREERSVRGYHARRKPRGDKVTVLAGGTSVEEIIEGATIAVGLAVESGAGIVVAIAVVIDNLVEAMSIGELVREEQKGKRRGPARRTLTWTAILGGAVLGSAILGWLGLRDMPPTWIGFLFSLGGGGIFYLSITSLIPEAEERHYQQSAGLTAGAGFVIVFGLAHVL